MKDCNVITDMMAEKLQQLLTTPGTTVAEIVNTAGQYCRIAYSTGRTDTAKRIEDVIGNFGEAGLWLPADSYVTVFQNVMAEIQKVDPEYRNNKKE